ncbi:hypothetical protein ASPZODRAFT_58748 [Penicilliopsis zonata CBS 506.65]|uniref:AHC1-like C2H2 zinc-finger domain-containing protein n=1 Tax=Penicilliopsis zonata CBS 506.65 TaxID=1073090 RepID=A0A1L9SQT9_9EURO|nr:hypothetical protein ASPZODRAFT_58748 [Penicilliopsis zonata CBS 506.65]OJJ49595.1 hypothetical protein ASPZODRAFT_58748 [Penicilliopsis zonata CBS 506.65]
MLAAPGHCPPPSGMDSSSFALLPPLKRKRSESSSDSVACIDAPSALKLRHVGAAAAAVAATAAAAAAATATTTNTMRTTTNTGTADHLHPSLATTPELAYTTTSTETSIPSSNMSHASTSDRATTAVPPRVDRDRLRETLEAQLSLEVLLKHNELRLIDQEIAKCQVALEQLRRCAEIPYPGSSVTAALSQSVSSGTGPAVLPPGNGPAPQSPAPWGVTNGPYTRHYARWLLPDPRFDGGEVAPELPFAGHPSIPEGRSTRGNPGDMGLLLGTSRSQRGAGGARLQSLPSGYPAPKDKAGPMIIRRKSDGVMVKLICLDCRRDNFSSTQGFINHCRIAHNRNFASHDAAAMASGEPVEVDESGAIIGGKVEPSSFSSSSSSNNNTNTNSNAASAAFVHPLIRSARAIDSGSASQEVSAGSTPRKSSEAAVPLIATPTPRYAAHRKKTASASMSASHASSFTASPDAPHLSSLMQLRGVGLDLGQLVGEAKTAVDLDAYSSAGEESDGEPSEPLADSKMIDQTPLPVSSRGSRQPMRTTVAQTSSQRPDSRKRLDSHNHNSSSSNNNKPSHLLESLTPRSSIPYTSPYGPVSPVTDHAPPPGHLENLAHGADFSPHTLESNQAPSLVSDDEDDYEAASESESPSPSPSEAGDEDDRRFDDIEVEDEDEEGNTTSTTSTTNRHPRSLSKPLKAREAKKKDGLIAAASIVSLGRGKNERRVRPITESFDPSKISLSTFRRLLACYPGTVREVFRSKAKAKLEPRGKKAKAAAAAQKDKVRVYSDSEEKSIQDAIETGVKLDEWRYVTLPALIKERGSGEDVYINKDELVKLIEWKVTHGHFRPTLVGMAKSNSEITVRKTSKAAFAAIPSDTTDKNLRLSFPKTSMDTLTKALRGVGPATASLILSAGTAARDPEHEVPFYSDEVYLWLCLEVFPSAEKGEVPESVSKHKRPNGELSVKYNMPEFSNLYTAVQSLRSRLQNSPEGEEEEDPTVSILDIEKVAFVLGHIEVAGYFRPAVQGKGEKQEGKPDEESREGAESTPTTKEAQQLKRKHETEQLSERATRPKRGKNKH